MALPGDPAGEGAGLIVGMDGGMQFSLGPGGLPAGWLSDTLFFFAREATGWRLLRTDGTNTMPLATAGGVPEDPKLVSALTP